MDPQIDLPDLVENLKVDIDELTTALDPLLSKPLSTTASSLPLLDKAKLYCLAAYAIESLLFASLTASGINATEHAVFKEIARLRQYNTKIKEIEERGIKGSAEGRARLDVAAAGRFIKHGLAGNDKYDLERQERMAKERARAHLKAQQINKKFDDEEAGVMTKKRGIEDEQEEVQEESPAVKKQRVDANDIAITQPKKRGRPSKKDRNAQQQQQEEQQKETKTRTSRRVTTQTTQDDEQDDDDEEGWESISDHAPKTRSETFSALLDGSLSEKKKKEKQSKARGGRKVGRARGK